MTTCQYQDLLAFASILLKKHSFYDDPHDIVHDAYLIQAPPSKEDVKKAFWQRYGAAVEFVQFRKKPSVEKTRICNKCREELPTAAFTRNGGIRHTCDRCVNAYSQQWNAKNRKKRRAIARKSYHKNKHKARYQYDPKKYKQERKKNPERFKLKNARLQLKRKIGGR